MNDAHWVVPGLAGAVVGIAVAAVLGLTVGGLQTPGESARRTEAAVKAAVTAALVPVCLDRSDRDPSREARLALLRQASASTQRDLLMDTGWATIPGSPKADSDLAQACLAALDLPAS